MSDLPKLGESETRLGLRPRHESRVEYTPLLLLLLLLVLLPLLLLLLVLLLLLPSPPAQVWRGAPARKTSEAGKRRRSRVAARPLKGRDRSPMRLERA